MDPSPVSKRIASALSALRKNDYETSLLNIFPALDATAKKRRPHAGVAKRIKEFIQDQIGIITPIGMKTVFGRDCTFGGITLDTALYNFVRNPLIHEGGLPSNFKFVNSKKSIVGGNWQLSNDNVLALLISVVTATENCDEQLSTDVSVFFLEQRFYINDLWGKENELRNLIVLCWPTPLTISSLQPYRT